LPNVIKIGPYNFELYRFKLGAFFLRHSVNYLITVLVYWNISVPRCVKHVAVFCSRLLGSLTR